MHNVLHIMYTTYVYIYISTHTLYNRDNQGLLGSIGRLLPVSGESQRRSCAAQPGRGLDRGVPGTQLSARRACFCGSLKGVSILFKGIDVLVLTLMILK